MPEEKHTITSSSHGFGLGLWWKANPQISNWECWHVCLSQENGWKHPQLLVACLDISVGMCRRFDMLSFVLVACLDISVGNVQEI